MRGWAPRTSDDAGSTPRVGYRLCNVTSVIIDLAISQDALLHAYRGDARNVQAHARDGRSVRFPASILRPFVSHAGVHGTFRIVFDDAGKFQSVERC
jgi:hypothetical protein